MPSTALDGITVLDLSRVLAAPLTAQLLADMGAEVIKVERPGLGDEAREYGPPFLKSASGQPTDDSAFFLSCNRNKKSVSVDFSNPAGQDIITKLAKRADVVIENFKTGTLARYGLDYESLHAVNPKLVYCSVTGFGQDGPMAKKPGYDGIFQAMSGMMSVSGHPDGKPGGGPMKVGISMVDILTSLYASNAILAALRHRDTSSGAGQHIDMSLLDCGLASLSHYAMNFLVSGELPQRRGNGGFGGVPSQTFKCADREIFIVAGNNGHFGRLCQAIGHPELARDPRFSDTAQRIVNRDALLEELGAIFIEQPADDWLAKLDAADVPASSVNNLAQALEEPQIKHREMVQTTEHAVAGPIQFLRNPIRFSETPIENYSAPPVVGQHTDEVLDTLGFTESEIAALREKNII